MAAKRYTPGLGRRIAKHLAEGGMTYTEIAEVVGVHRATIFAWKNKYPKFKELIEDAEEEKYRSRLAMAERSQQKLLEGWTSTDETIEYDSEGKVKKKTISTKYYAPDRIIVIHALKSLDARYNVPERFDHTTAGDKIPGTAAVIPNVFIQVKNSKSLQLEDEREN